MRLVTPTWPAGHRSALAIAFRVDGAEGGGAATPPPTYTATGTARLLRLLADAGVQATFGWTAAASEIWPHLLERCIEDGHEVALISPPAAMTLDHSPTDVEASLTAAVERLQANGADRVAGLLADRIDVTDPPRAMLSEIGMTWLARPAWADLPEIAGAVGDDRRIVETPVWAHSSGDGETGASVLGTEAALSRWRDDLDVLRDEGPLLALSFDAADAGQPGFSRWLLHFLDDASDLGDVWVARLGDISRWWLERNREGRP